MLTTTIGAYPKPDHVPVRDWFQGEEATDVAEPTAGYAEIVAKYGARLQVILDRATVEIVKEQDEIGIDVPTDGEIRRENFIHYHCRHLRGIDFEALTEKEMREQTRALPTITGPIEAGGPFLARDWQVAQGATRKPVKMTVPGPLTIAAYLADAFYGDDARARGAALADALNVEIRRLADAGCPVIQLDEPAFAREVDHALAFGLEHLERTLHRVPGSTQRLVHVCCGYPTRLDEEDYPKAPNEAYFELADGLDEIAIDAVSIEDAHRPNDLALLERFARRTVILGVIVIARSKVESVEEVRERLSRAREHIDPHRLIAAPDCGLGLRPRSRPQEARGAGRGGRGPLAKLTASSDEPKALRVGVSRRRRSPIGRPALERKKLQALRLAAQQMASDAGRDGVGRHCSTIEQGFRGQQGVPCGPAGLLDPRCRIHGVTDEGYLSLEAADLTDHERTRMEARAKAGDLPMARQKIGPCRFQRVPTGEQAADRTSILLRCADRPGGDQGITDVTMHLAALVGHHPREAGESLGEQGVGPDVADSFSNAGRAHQVEEENDPLLLPRVVVTTAQEIAEDIRADQLNDRGQGDEHEGCGDREHEVAHDAWPERAGRDAFVEPGEDQEGCHGGDAVNDRSRKYGGRQRQPSAATLEQVPRPEQLEADDAERDHAADRGADRELPRPAFVGFGSDDCVETARNR
jgi:5-methyltetrahydropteroyltriglutamate--homocysteine methyltransferase